MRSIEPRLIWASNRVGGPMRLYGPDGPYEMNEEATLMPLKSLRFSYFNIIDYVILDGVVISNNIDCPKRDVNFIGNFYYTKEIVEAVTRIRGNDGIY